MRLALRNRQSHTHGETLRQAHSDERIKGSRARFDPREEPSAEIVSAAPVPSLGSPVHPSIAGAASLRLGRGSCGRPSPRRLVSLAPRCGNGFGFRLFEASNLVSSSPKCRFASRFRNDTLKRTRDVPPTAFETPRLGTLSGSRGTSGLSPQRCRRSSLSRDDRLKPSIRPTDQKRFRAMPPSICLVRTSTPPTAIHRNQANCNPSQPRSLASLVPGNLGWLTQSRNPTKVLDAQKSSKRETRGLRHHPHPQRNLRRISPPTQTCLFPFRSPLTSFPSAGLYEIQIPRGHHR